MFFFVLLIILLFVLYIPALWLCSLSITISCLFIYLFKIVGIINVNIYSIILYNDTKIFLFKMFKL